MYFFKPQRSPKHRSVCSAGVISKGGKKARLILSLTTAWNWLIMLLKLLHRGQVVSTHGTIPSSTSVEKRYTQVALSLQLQGIPTSLPTGSLPLTAPQNRHLPSWFIPLLTGSLSSRALSSSVTSLSEEKSEKSYSPLGACSVASFPHQPRSLFVPSRAQQHTFSSAAVTHCCTTSRSPI